MVKKIKRAIISVSNKSGLEELGKLLNENEVEIYSTGGTLKSLSDWNIPVKSIESYTKFPEILDGRVKTLHPKIHGGILARRSVDSHLESLKNHEILEFDLVCINLYPFEEVIQKSEFSFEEAIENIDIGGPSMIRAAAKNYEDVAVLTTPDQYPDFIKRFKENKGALSKEYRFELAVDAFNRTGEYDSIISEYLNKLQGDYYPQTMNLSLKKNQTLRYGENPHQNAAFYSNSLTHNLPWKCFHGKELSYNNILDMDSALSLILNFSLPVCAIFKHTNPCGVSAGTDQVTNLKNAMKADPVSFFGGIFAFNTKIERATAEIMAQEFIEIIIAPDYAPEAREILMRKKNVRLIELPDFNMLKRGQFEIKSSAFGFLIQESDRYLVTEKDLKVVSQKKPAQKDIEELLFAFHLVKNIKSNAVVFTNNKTTLGVGAGQMSRLDSIKIAIEKSREFGISLKDSYLASDAFFPFPDGVIKAIEAGAKAIIQPGGSIKDDEVIKAADDAGVIMIFTGHRHFKH